MFLACMQLSHLNVTYLSAVYTSTAFRVFSFLFTRGNLTVFTISSGSIRLLLDSTWCPLCLIIVCSYSKTLLSIHHFLPIFMASNHQVNLSYLCLYPHFLCVWHQFYFTCDQQWQKTTFWLKIYLLLYYTSEHLAAFIYVHHICILPQRPGNCNGSPELELCTVVSHHLSAMN